MTYFRKSRQNKSFNCPNCGAAERIRVECSQSSYDLCGVCKENYNIDWHEYESRSKVPKRLQISVYTGLGLEPQSQRKR